MDWLFFGLFLFPFLFLFHVAFYLSNKALLGDKLSANTKNFAVYLWRHLLQLSQNLTICPPHP